MHSILDDLSQLQADADAAAPDGLSIRGVELRLDRLVDFGRFEPASVAALHHAFTTAEPFPHLVVDGLFNADLLALVAEEFDLLHPSKWRRSTKGDDELTMRSLGSARLGHAAELYFGLLHSGWFVDFLQQVSGVDALITDPGLQGGGFHESRLGGRFRVHTDFNKHLQTKLDNEMVLITYLNKDWDPAWNGALELWSTEHGECVRRIEPVFGRTVLMRHSPVSFHGHPTPLAPPAGRVRRSVAAYFYANRPANERTGRHGTQFLHHRPGRLRAGARQLVPPLLWNAMRKLVRR